MNLRFLLSGVILGLLLITAAVAQDPNAIHFAKDGLSFDYPKNWSLSDQSTQQMQLIELTQGDTTIRVRSPREYLTTPEKTAHAKKLFQDNYVNDFYNQVQGAGMTPKRSEATTQIAGGNAEGARVRAVLGGETGGMDSYFRILSDRLINLSIIGSETEIAKSAAWNMIRASIKIEPAPQPKPTNKPSPTPRP